MKLDGKKKRWRLHWCQNKSKNSKSVVVFLVSSSHYAKKMVIAIDVFCLCPGLYSYLYLNKIETNSANTQFKTASQH